MDDYGYFRVRAFVPEVKIGDPKYNIDRIIHEVWNARMEGVDCIVFPEMSVTGYTCADLFQQELLIKKSESEIGRLVTTLASVNILIAVGAPVLAFGKMYDCAVMICKGEIVGIVPKSHLPNYGEFYEKRWFESGKKIKGAKIKYCGQEVPFGVDLIFTHEEVKIGVEICEDLWVPQPPSGQLAMAGAEVILNLSASNEVIGKHEYLVSLITQQSARCRCAYVYASAGWGESTTDVVFTGKAIIAEDGKGYGIENKFLTHSLSETRDIDIDKIRLDRAKFNTFIEKENYTGQFRYIDTNWNQHTLVEFKEHMADVNPYPFVPNDPSTLNKRCEEIINIQSFGLMKRLVAIGTKKAVIGISGGLDSTLALLVTINAFDKLKFPRKQIIGVTMPGKATSSRTKNNAVALMEQLGVSTLEIPIEESMALHFKAIGQDPNKYDATYENAQARERTQILMDLANKEGGIVVGTGDMSELALGWCTFNGDQMAMYGVNASVPKTLVKYLVNWFAEKSEDKVSAILKDICATPISPELVPSSGNEIGQKTEDIVGPYELHDFFLYNFVRNSFTPAKIYILAEMAFKDKYRPEIIMKWLKVFIKRFFSQQFKRSCLPDSPKVGSVSLSPRGDWRMPSDATCDMWLNQLEELEDTNV